MLSAELRECRPSFVAAAFASAVALPTRLAVNFGALSSFGFRFEATPSASGKELFGYSIGIDRRPGV